MDYVGQSFSAATKLQLSPILFRNTFSGVGNAAACSLKSSNVLDKVDLFNFDQLGHCLALHLVQFLLLLPQLSSTRCCMSFVNCQVSVATVDIWFVQCTVRSWICLLIGLSWPHVLKVHMRTVTFTIRYTLRQSFNYVQLLQLHKDLLIKFSIGVSVDVSARNENKNRIIII